jgi:hypothetical protein
MKSVLINVLLLFTLISFGQTELPKNCAPYSNKFMKDSTSGTISYLELNLKISILTADRQIDSILYITLDKDTLDRFKDSQLKEFEEILPFIGIPDWQLLPRINKMYPEPIRQREYKKLEYTYRELSPHLFGVYKDNLAVLKCSEGYNFIDRKGNLQYDCFFENATNFIDGKATVKYSGKWYKIDKEGKFYPL